MPSLVSICALLPALSLSLRYLCRSVHLSCALWLCPDVHVRFFVCLQRMHSLCLSVAISVAVLFLSLSLLCRLSLSRARGTEAYT